MALMPKETLHPVSLATPAYTLSAHVLPVMAGKPIFLAIPIPLIFRPASFLIGPSVTNVMAPELQTAPLLARLCYN